ncbi:hypothetical protein WJX81_003303 [Elliptochloris bilobata]|uniref:Septin-type G domain-containing protein n=1 Tax=Elliptochloris bilobata TaxID=381761 RepID=A0AAW1RD03_9CHLO
MSETRSHIEEQYTGDVSMGKPRANIGEGHGSRTPERPHEGSRFDDDLRSNAPSEQPRSLPDNVTQHEDPTTHEVKYTADVGREGAGTKAGFFGDATFTADVRAAFAGVPRVKPQWRDRYMKVLIVGESGLGKTTFIKNLLAAYAQDPDLTVNDAAGPDAAKTFESAPEKMCTTIVVRDHSTMTAFNYRVQDTPGYDRTEDNIEPIVHYCEEACTRCLAAEQDTKRKGALTAEEDPRVDVALYFIAPHRLRPIDIDFITRLSELVPVVPIIAKADSLTTPELRDFRMHVRAQLEHAGKGAKRDLLHAAFNAEALDEAGARREAPPFAVVASTDYDLSVGRFWPVRRYPWGNCEALSSVHSDLPALKRLLFEVGFEDLKAATDQRYYQFRSQQLLHLDDPNMPINRSSLTAHLHRTLKSPGEEGLRATANKALRWLGSAVAFYFAANLVLGGRKRVDHDLHKIKEVMADVVDVASDKAIDYGSVALSKADEATNVAARATANKVAEVKERLTGAEEEARRQAEEAERERRRKERRGPFGLFGPRDRD